MNTETEQERDERRCLRAWRGLAEHVLLGLNRLDKDAIARGTDSFVEKRKLHIISRMRCLEIRKERDLDHYNRPLQPWKAPDQNDPY